MKGQTSGLAQSQFQPYYKMQSRFVHFRKFRLVISSTRGVIFTSFKPCPHFVGRWQTVQTQIRRHITMVALDQVMSSSKRLKWGNSNRHIWVNSVKRVIFGSQFHETLHVPFLLWKQYDISLWCSNDNSMSLLLICNWALHQSIIEVCRKPKPPPIMPKTRDQI